MPTSDIQLKGLEGLSSSVLDIIQDGPFSTVKKEKWFSDDGTREEYLAVKVSPTVRDGSKEPHDIIKELRILSHISHINVIDILGERATSHPQSLCFWMPFIPHSLYELLSLPSFSPHSRTGPKPPSKVAEFALLAKSITFQVIAALKYLHSESIAHRDVKPKNILLDMNGCVKLIDFGISWERAQAVPSGKRKDLWPEQPGSMYFQVSTGPYRAPELLFGAQSYDAFAIDLWSFGANFAEFFTPLRLCYDGDDEDDGNYGSNTSDKIKTPFIMPQTQRMYFSQARWVRDSLFNPEQGDIGLAWSIFKCRGTPTDEIWPTFKDLQTSGSLMFKQVPPAHLPSLLPNLPLGASAEVPSDADPGPFPHFLAGEMTPSPLDLLQRFLVYPPPQRLKAAEALRHPWFVAEPSVILPAGYPANIFETNFPDHPSSIEVWENKGLGEWLIAALNAV